MNPILGKVSVSCNADGRIVDELEYPRCKHNENGQCTAEDIEIEVHSQPNAVTYFNCFTFEKGFNITAKWNIYAKNEEEE